jgi:outer membrane protein assembly factor BamB
MGRRFRTRLFAVVVSVVLVAALAVIGYRVFAPHDTLTRPTVAYPSVVLITDDRPFSELRAAPLVIEGRLRVYAEKWRIWADAPVGERYESTPYWAFRRWPAELVGVVSAETQAGPIVVSQWSDGELIALDAKRGEITWRAKAPVGTSHYDGRRTGATVVYEPRSLLTVRLGKQTVVISTDVGVAAAFDVSTGAQLWRRAVPGPCEQRAWTGVTLLMLPGCGGRVITMVSVATGQDLGQWTPPGVEPATPTLCGLGRSECRLVTIGDDAWLLREDGGLTPLPPLEPGAVLAGDRVVYPTQSGVAARRLTDGEALWSWNGTGKLIAADTVGVYLLTQDRTVLGLSPVTGHLTELGCASSQPNEGWQIGHVHPTDGSYLALERLTNAPASAADQQYYYGPRPVALVELYSPTKLPVWPGKFAACAPF